MTRKKGAKALSSGLFTLFLIIASLSLCGCEDKEVITDTTPERRGIDELREAYPGYVYVEDIVLTETMTDVQKDQYVEKVKNSMCFGIGKIENIMELNVFDNVIKIVSEYLDIDKINDPEDLSYEKLMEIVKGFAQGYVKTLVEIDTQNWDVVLGSPLGPGNFVTYSIGDTITFTGKIHKVDWPHGIIFAHDGGIKKYEHK